MLLLPLLLAGASVLADASDSYDVTAGPDARVLQVEARFNPGAGGCYEVDERGNDFILSPEIEQAGKWRPLPQRSGCVEVAPASTIHLRYRFRLADAAAGKRRGDAWERPGVLFARPSFWLLRPVAGRHGAFRLHVSTPRGVTFATGLVPAAADTYEGRAERIDRVPYSLFGDMTLSSVDAGGSRVDIAVTQGALAVGREDIDNWVRRAARAVVAYTGAFPLPRILVAVVPSNRGGVGFGTTWGYGGASIVISVGAAATRADLDSDWELTHEMVHLTLPNMPNRERWMEEGLATYVEPMARCVAGQLDEPTVWRDLVRQLPRGLPQAGDRGLDETHTWARTYWGGALFWFIVDVRLRETTDGRTGLAELMRGFHERQADIRIEWDVKEMLDTAEALTHVPVVREVYAELAEKPGSPDLEVLWSRLGVRAHDGDVTFDDSAPLASIRRAMTRAITSSRHDHAAAMPSF